MEQKILKQRIVFRRLIQGLIILAIFIMALTPIWQENDIYWQMVMGRDIVQKHTFPVKDPYNLPAQGAVWTLHEWLPSVSFYLVNERFGSTGLILEKASVVALTFAIFMLLFNRLKANLYLSLLIFALGVLVNTRGSWMVFPSIFEYLFLVLTLYLLEIYRGGKNKFILGALGLLSLVWANSHGSFFLLPIIAISYVLGDFLMAKIKLHWGRYDPVDEPLGKKGRFNLLRVGIISLVTPLLTPNHFDSYFYPFKISLGKFTPYVAEYQKFWQVWHWNWADFVQGFTFILMVALWGLLIFNLRRVNMRDLLLVLFFTLLALSAARHVAVFALLAVFLVVKYLGLFFREYRGLFKRSLMKDLLLLILIILTLYYYKTKIAPFGFGWSEDDFPKAAAELIVNNRVVGNMFNHYNYGGYLIWKMPGYKVFMDGRLEMYEGGAGEDYKMMVTAKPGYKELLNHYQINFAINYLTDPISVAMSRDPSWKYVYNDHKFVLFIRDVPQNKEFLSKYWSETKEKEFQEAYKRTLNQYQAEILRQKGIEAAQKGNFQAAVDNLRNATIYNPTAVNIHLNLAELLTQLRMYPEAKQEYEYILSNLDSQNQNAKRGLEKVRVKIIK